MATLCKRTNGSFEIHFYDQGTRKYITLGGRKYSEKTATELKGIVETLLYYRSPQKFCNIPFDVTDRDA